MVLEEVEHIYVSMKSCEVKWSESIIIWVIEPGSELPFETASHFTTPMKGLEVLHVDAQLGKLILECRKMHQGGLIFLAHDRKIEIGSLFQIGAQVVV